MLLREDLSVRIHQILFHSDLSYVVQKDPGRSLKLEDITTVADALLRQSQVLLRQGKVSAGIRHQHEAIRLFRLSGQSGKWFRDCSVLRLLYC